MPNVDAAVGEFNSFASHSLQLRFVRNIEGVNFSVILEFDEVGKMGFRDFTVEHVEKINSINNAGLIFRQAFVII